MVHRKASLLVALALAALVLPATALALTLRAHAARRPAAPKPKPMPTSTPSTSIAEIGPLYANARAPRHGCTASVVHSSHGDTLITAAHCVTGNAAGMVFVPGQRGAQRPYGTWTVTAAHLAARWVSRQDPDDDVAFLTVAPHVVNGVKTEVEQVTGAFSLGATPRRGLHVTVTGYPAGTTNDPIACSTTTYLTRSFPSFDCGGYVSGTSGSPWLRVTASGTEIVASSAASIRAGVMTTRPTAPLSPATPRTPIGAPRSTRRPTLRRSPAATAADLRPGYRPPVAGSRVDSTTQLPGAPRVMAAAPSQKLGTNDIQTNWLAASDRRLSFR